MPIVKSTVKAVRKPVLNTAVARSLSRGVNKTLLDVPSIPEHNLFRAEVYRGGPIKDPYFSFFTTDPEYASQYGPLHKYLLEQKGIAGITKEPMIGSGDVVANDMFIDRNGPKNGNIIIGHDMITSDIPIKSKGIEILSYRPPQTLKMIDDLSSTYWINRSILPETKPYQIERYPGYMLKSLMEGNPLEKQLSKVGTVNANNVRALIGKGSKVEQSVVDKVLASEGFAGKKSIDYNKFRKAVQDELITYDRTPDTRWEDYGVSGLGLKQSEDLSHLRNIEDYARSDRFEVVSTDTIGQARLWLDKSTGDILNWDGITQRYLGEHDVNAGPGLNTFTFSSSRIPRGSGKHYDPNTLGHSRTYTTADEPDILHVMESQSDWAQQSHRGKKIKTDPQGAYITERARVRNFENSIQQMEENLTNGMRPDGSRIEYEYEKRDIQQIIDNEKRHLNDAVARLKKYEMAAMPDKYTQELYLQDNYATRQIQENLRYAAEKGQKKMRYPTRETAAKIEGYQPAKDTGKKTEVFDWLKKNNRESSPYSSEIYEKTQKLQTAIEADLATTEDINRAKAEIKKLESLEARWLKGEITYSTDLETILSKYEGFPKEYQKLYKNADVRIVTDPKGNTWYEVDVPENYLQQEWQYRHGGIIKAQGGLSKLAKTIATATKTSKNISVLERLGVPKALRTDMKVLENPQYWGYPQWNSAYNTAVNSGNWNEVQRLRDLHFKVKAPDTKVVDENGNPLHTYHGLLDRISPEKAIKFNKYEGVNWDVEDAVEQGSKINHWKLAVPTWDIMTNYHSPNYNMVSRSYALGYKDLIYDDYLNIKNPFTYDEEAIHNIVNNFKPGSSTKTLKIEPARYKRRPLIDTDGKPIRDSKGRVIWSDPELIPERRYYDYSGVSDWAYFGGSRKPLMQLGYDGLYIPQYYDSYGAFVSPSQFKSAEPITRTDTGEIIPIVKRDNFHNLDRRYKQGGILKGQKGLGKLTKSTVKQLFKERPILRSIGSTEDYLRYYDTIFPKSVIQTPYTHGTTYDLSKGLYLTKPIPVTAAPETIKRNDLYLTLQPETGLQYIPGINSLPNYNWNKQYWALKEILGKPYLADDYRRIPITTLRQQIPNRAGQFDRSDITQVGHGKFLQEYKNDFGLSTLSDEDFLKNLGVRIGETLDEFAKRNREVFKQIYDAGSYINNSKGGLYHIKVDVKNPLLINRGNTYYNERGIFDIVDKNKNDAIIHNNADNELGSDVLIIPNASPTNVRVLGSEPDIKSFYEYVKNK